MVVEDDLKANIKEFLESSEDNLSKKRYNSSIACYFKAISSICDLKIYEAKRTLPKSHSERFLFLKISFPEVYKIISSLFNTYTKTYNIRLGLKEAMLFKENAKKIKELFEKQA